MGNSEIKILVNQVLKLSSVFALRSSGKSMKRNQRLMQVVLVIFQIGFVHSVSAPANSERTFKFRAPRMSFGDTTDYLLIASQSLFSSKFWLSDRPLLIPLFFKILGSNPHSIFMAQLYLSVICWGILAATCTYIVRSYPFKFFVFAVVLGFSSINKSFYGIHFFSSESLHFSLVALLL